VPAAIRARKLSIGIDRLRSFFCEGSIAPLASPSMSKIDVYLLRHEAADDAPYDDHRALTGEGRARMRRTGALFAVEMRRLDVIYTSPLVRAVQTAEILAGAIGFDEPLLVAPELAQPPTLDALVRLVDDTHAATRGVALVGHEPILGALVGRLLGGPSHAFARGEIVALERDRASRHTQLLWRIRPEGPEKTHDLDR
jgi:phosphohistidine phosphatase